MAENQTVRSHTVACRECGTVIGRAAEFCWRCGATYSPHELEGGEPASAGQTTGATGDGSVFGLVDRLRSADTLSSPTTPARTPGPGAQPVNVLGSSLPTAQSDFEPPNFGMLDAKPTKLSEQLEPREEVEFSFLRKIVHSVNDDDEEQERRRQRRILIRRITMAAAVLLLVVIGLTFSEPLANYARRANTSVRDYISKTFRPAPKPQSHTEPQVAARTSPARQAPRSGRSEPSTPPPMGVVVEGQPGTHATYIGASGATSTVATSVGPRISTGGLRSNMRVTISPAESRALLVRHISPVYPDEARRRRIEGSVTVRATIGTDGLVHNVQPVEGNAVLLKAATDAVKQWLYRPYLRNGEAMEIDTLVVVEFSLAAGA